MQNLAQLGTHSQSRRRPDVVHWLLLLTVTGQRELINWQKGRASRSRQLRLFCSVVQPQPFWASLELNFQSHCDFPVFVFTLIHEHTCLRSDIQDTLFYTTFELDDTRFLQFEDKNSKRTSLGGLALLSAWAKPIDTRWESFLTECIVTHLYYPASVFGEQRCGSPDAGRRIFKKWLQTGLWYGWRQWLQCSRVQGEQSG